MASTDSDGMVRVDVEWEIEGRKGTRTGKQYGLHPGELEGLKAQLKREARTGDTITVREI